MAKQWQDEADIRGLFDRYGSGVDERNWEAWGQIFDNPLETDFSGIDAAFKPVTRSRAAHVAATQAVISQFETTQHMITNVQIALHGDHAEAHAVMRAEHWMKGLRGAPRYTMFGVYENAFKRTAEGWRIARLSLRLIREEGNVAVWAEALRRAQSNH